ncbi:5-beta-cholestane-3-alpha,7-alpha-diol 12-alpha-hydroxylase-like [Sebastes fasciatus]|uniref:5-beta-cholestane-3-alpha,7-alpha-diol 12-alpha-hydroxylase-like n=1 Tax=Sebastes fasciatus TaxID=394691 RepID=UPI003D9E3054
MALLLPILLGFLAFLIGGLYLLGVFRQRRPGEPPLDKGFFPWLGHVLEFRKNTPKFLERMKQKHGDVFTVLKLDFEQFARQLVQRVFGYKSLENEHQLLMVTSHKHLRGAGLEVLTHSMMGNLQKVMLQNVGSSAVQKTWIEDSLFKYSFNAIFRAGYLSLFGNASDKSGESVDRAESEALFYKFCEFDRFLPDLAYGVLPPKEKMEAERLKAFFWNALSMQKMKTRDNISPWVQYMLRGRQELGIKESMIDKYMLAILWVSQGNTGPSAFWLLLFLMKHPEAMTAVKGEVDEVLKESGQEVLRDGPLINLTYDMLMKMPILDSAVEETLRLIAVSVLTRAVCQDLTLNMADGCKYHVRKGDRLAVLPHSVLHTDPEIHPDPHSFKYDRFLNPDGSKKTDFYKAGKKVKYYTMPWGAGTSMCPGRFFANNELKQFIVLMLVYFEVELKNPHEETPGTVASRLGFGAAHPVKDIQFRYRLRF